MELKREGWALAVVTGRELDDLKAICETLDLFDLAVVENGALLYLPSRREAVYLGEPPPPSLLRQLSKGGIEFSSGRVVVSAHSQWADAIQALINQLGLSREVILNRDSVMILPAGVDKASGLKTGAARFDIELPQIIGVGDAENDIEFLRACGLSVAVANALDSVKAAVDILMTQSGGQGVVELIRDYLLSPGGLNPVVSLGLTRDQPG